MKLKEYLMWIIALCVTFPFTKIIEYFYRRTPAYHTWKEWFFVYLGLTIIVTIVFITSSVLRFKRRFFQIELYEYSNIAYDDFLHWISEEKRNCELDYIGYTIKIKVQNSGYLCGIYGKNGLVSQRKFETLQELIEAKIISSQTIKEIWNEVEFHDTSGIVYEEAADED